MYTTHLLSSTYLAVGYFLRKASFRRAYCTLSDSLAQFVLAKISMYSAICTKVPIVVPMHSPITPMLY